MITTVNIAKQDVEEMIEKALAEYNQEHNKTPTHLILGRIAYEEYRNMQTLGNPGGKVSDHYKDLEILVMEEPTNILGVCSKPD